MGGYISTYLKSPAQIVNDLSGNTVPIATEKITEPVIILPPARDEQQIPVETEQITQIGQPKEELPIVPNEEKSSPILEGQKGPTKPKRRGKKY